MHQLIYICGFSAAVFSIVVAFLVYFKNFNSRRNRIFALFALNAFLAFASVTRASEFFYETSGFFWLKLFYVILFFLILNYVYLISAWLDLGGKIKKILLGAYLFAFVSIFIVFFDLFLEQSENFIYSGGPAFYFYFAAALASPIYLIYLLLLNHEKSHSLKKAQLKYLLAFSAFFYAATVSAFFVFYGNGALFSFFSFLFLSVLCGGYLFFRRRILELSAVFRKIFIFLSSFLSVSIFAVLLDYSFLSGIIRPFFVREFIVIVFAILIFTPIKNFYAWLARTYIFSYYYDAQKVIFTLNSKLKSTLSTDEIYGIIDDISAKIFLSKSFAVFSYNVNKRNCVSVYNNNFKNISKALIAGNEREWEYLSGDKIFTIEDLLESGQNGDLFDFLIKLKADLFIPIKIKGRPAGLFVFGPKKNGNMYDGKDLETLEIICAQASMAVENALMYQETKNFNIKLEEEVARATKELREANEKLTKLDKAKSEFISIASHQLRTPLTVIKGYISMLLEGNFGAVPEGIRDSIKKVYDSNERLIILVGNLLNISRIESGNQRFDMRRTDLEELAISAIDEMQNTALKQNKELIYKPSGANLPVLMVDSEKVRHVILNYIDNAIKYGEGGEIIITLKSDKDRVTFSIKDKGIGFSEDELTNLFKKFHRGVFSPLIYTEGTGLGLYVAKQIIESHGGRVWAESPGREKGATFYFSLPLPKT